MKQQIQNQRLLAASDGGIDLYAPKPTPTQNTAPQTSQTQQASSNLDSNPQINFSPADSVYLVILLAIGIASFLIWKLIDKYFDKKKKDELWPNTVFLEISVPKESAEQAQKDGNKKDDKEVLSVGEQIFLVMTDYQRSGFKNWFKPGHRFSMELVTIGQEVLFWVVCDKDTAGVIERQILAIYPRAQVKENKNPKFIKEGSFTFTQELVLHNRFELPFRTYKQMESDPLNALTSSMSGLTPDESAAIQLILSPVNEKWQTSPRILASKIQQGQSPKEVLSPETNPASIFFKGFKKFIFGIFKGKSDPSQMQNQERKIDLTGREVALQLTPQQQEIIKKLEEKSSRPGFKYTLRIVGAAQSKERAKFIVNNIVPAFQIYDIRPFNGFKKGKTDPKNGLLDFILRWPSKSDKGILNSEEVNSIWHLPNHLTQTANVKYLLSRKPPIPLGIPGPGDKNVFIGQAVSGGKSQDVYMKQEDRLRHIYALGGSGSGKSVFMSNLILQDIAIGNGVCIVDPHGELVDDILLRMPKERADDVIVFSPAIIDKPLGLNMLETDPKKPTEKTLVIDALFTIWDKLYDLKATGGPMFEQYMKNSIRLVMSYPEAGNTMMEIAKVLSDEDFRSFRLAMCDEREVVDFWEKQAEKAEGDASLQNMVPYITSKLAPFVTNDFLRPMIGQTKSAINFRQAMDNKKIILVKLEKGLIGEGSAYLVGMVIINNILLAGMGRNDGLRYNEDGTTTEILAKDRPPFFVYIDEMQNFLFDSIPKALEEIRKYKVGFVLAHQFVKQVISKGDERIKDSIMANTGSKFIFRCSPDDAQYLEKDFAPTMTSNDLINPERFTSNCILLVDGQRLTPFNLKVPPMSDKIDVEFKKELIEMTKTKYGRDKETIEKEIADRATKFLF